MTKHVETGQELYLSTMDDNNEVTTKKVYVIEHNSASIYFGYSKYDSKNSYMRIKATGTFPEVWHPSIIEIYYLSDDSEYGEQWGKRVKMKSQYKSQIERDIDDLFSFNHSVDDYKRVADFLKSIV